MSWKARDAIRVVAARLGELSERAVFLGGAAAGLLVTDSASGEPRPTDDIDVAIATTSWRDYESSIHARLRSLGFKEDIESDIICRWVVDGIKVDVLPTDTRILGFSNPWYRDAVENAVDFQLDERTRIRLITAPYFLATKLVAYFDRGLADPQLSNDLQDIVAVLDGRPSLLAEIVASAGDVRSFIAAGFGRLLADGATMDALEGQIGHDSSSQERLPRLRAMMVKISIFT